LIGILFYPALKSNAGASLSLNTPSPGCSNPNFIVKMTANVIPTGNCFGTFSIQLQENINGTWQGRTPDVRVFPQNSGLQYYDYCQIKGTLRKDGIGSAINKNQIYPPTILIIRHLCRNINCCAS
jgi:hypothetical protein